MISVDACMRAKGHSVTICACKTPDGFLPCPDEVRRKLTPVYPPAAYPAAVEAIARDNAAVPSPEAPPRLVYSKSDKHLIARQSGYTGNECPNCYGVKMRWNGTCEVCDECGTQGGCS